ncbi:MAG TPA: ABC transporter permease [Crocinitomicaceae bacterium]|nr:ABC transporter permease [Crocinitomicaceae bacterium]
MLNKLLFKNQDKKQLIIAIIGAFMGITFLITSIHYLIRVNEFGEGADILGPNTIIVQKKVSNSSTLGFARTDFSKNEIQKIKDKPFIHDVKPVIANNFDVSFETADPLVPRFRSDVFIQTVDPEFLDVDLTNWDWKEGNDFVPMIMPRDFLVMLNTFMSASGIPQISDDLAMDIKFKFTLSNNSDSEKEWVDARIVGFTNEVASILVPETFMTYGNNKFSDGTEQKITQVMISGEESEFGLVEEMLEKRGLETKNSQMVVGRLKSMVGTLFLVVLGISVIAVFVSGLVLIQYMQLLMTRNSYEVRTLMRMGHHPKKIIRMFFLYFVKIFGVVAGLGLILFFIFKFFLDSMFANGGLYIGTSVTIGSISALLIAYALFAFASYRTATKGIFNEY